MSKYYNEKAKERSNRYRADKRDKLTLDLPKGAKDKYKAHALSRGKRSLTALIIELLEADIEQNK
ncbi:MAG: antitoxin [Ruminococcus flavefaciens]|nr:antitoxin [Ruminococcus flavefaciens]